MFEKQQTQHTYIHTYIHTCIYTYMLFFVVCFFRVARPSHALRTAASRPLARSLARSLALLLLTIISKLHMGVFLLIGVARGSLPCSALSGRSGRSARPARRTTDRIALAGRSFLELLEVACRSTSEVLCRMH